MTKYLNKISLPNQKKLLYVVIVIFMLLVYNLAIKKTVLLYLSCNEINAKNQEMESSPVLIAKLENELKQIEEKISNINSPKERKDPRQNLLQMASEYCSLNNIILKEMPVMIETTQGDYNITTNALVLQGNFINLLNFLNILEKSNTNSIVVSIDYKIYKDVINNQKNLNLIIYVQNISKK